MDKKDQEKTAFFTGQGLYYYKAMPFCLKNTRGPCHYLEMIHTVYGIFGVVD